MNDHQKKRFADDIIATLYNTVADKKITLFGWAFKKATNETRESGAIYVADHLLNEKANVAVYEPKVKENKMLNDLNYLRTRAESENTRGVNGFHDPYKACKGAHAIAIITEWDEFKELDWQKIYDNMMKPAFVFDGRGILGVDVLTNIGFVVDVIGEKTAL